MLLVIQLVAVFAVGTSEATIIFGVGLGVVSLKLVLVDLLDKIWGR